jgi:hypothetical protein
MLGRRTNDTLEGLSAILKAVRNRNGFTTDNQGELDRIRVSMNLYSARLKMLADAKAGSEKTKQVPTSFAMEAKKMDQARTGDYWSEPHEMAARAFAAYVEDKVSEKGGQSDFLIYHAHGGILVPMIDGFIARPYPEGKEREATNAAFDKFVGTLKTRETEKGVALFSGLKKGEGNENLPSKESPEQGGIEGTQGGMREQRGEQRSAGEPGMHGEPIPGKPETRTDAERIGNLEDGIRRETGEAFPVGGIRLADDPADADRVRAVADVFKKRVIFVENTRPDLLMFEGVILPADPGTIFLVAKARDLHMAILGHEMFHAMEIDAPGLAQEFYDAIKDDMRGVNRQDMERAVNQQGIQVMTEALSNIMGNQFTREGFWQKIAEREPGLFRRVYEFLKAFLADIRYAITPMKLTEAFVGNIDKIENAASAVMAKYARQIQSGQTSMFPAEAGPKFSIKQSTNQGETLDSIIKKWEAHGVAIDAFDYHANLCRSSALRSIRISVSADWERWRCRISPTSPTRTGCA